MSVWVKKFCGRCGREDCSGNYCESEVHFENYCTICGKCIGSVMFPWCGWCYQEKVKK